MGGAVPGRSGGGWARGRDRRGAHKMENPDTLLPSPSFSFGRRRPASKPQGLFFCPETKTTP